MEALGLNGYLFGGGNNSLWGDLPVDGVFIPETVGGSLGTNRKFRTSIRCPTDLTNGVSNTLLAVEQSASWKQYGTTSQFRKRFWTGYPIGGIYCAMVGILPVPIIDSPDHPTEALYQAGYRSPTDFFSLPADVRPAKNKAIGGQIQAFSSGGFNCLMADGSVKNANPNVSNSSFAAVTVFDKPNGDFVNWD